MRSIWLDKHIFLLTAPQVPYLGNGTAHHQPCLLPQGQKVIAQQHCMLFFVSCQEVKELLRKRENVTLTVLF